MKKTAFLIALLLFAAIGSYAQEQTQSEHFIEVTGTAELEVTPNEIYLTIRLKEFEEGRVKTTLETIDKSFLNTLKEAGIDTKNLELADAGLLLGGRRRDRDVFREKTYQLKLSGAAEVEKFLSKIENVKADYVDIVRVDHSELTKLKLDVKVKALQIAKTKAQALAHSIGSELGKPILIRELSVEPYNLSPGNAQYSIMNVQYRDKAELKEYESSFKKIKLQAQVLVQFEIK